MACQLAPPFSVVPVAVLLAPRSYRSAAAGSRAAFPAVAVTVLAVTLIAAYIPARRASRVNPTDALRYE
jgi:hypothetical protein